MDTSITQSNHLPETFYDLLTITLYEDGLPADATRLLVSIVRDPEMFALALPLLTKVSVRDRLTRLHHVLEPQISPVENSYLQSVIRRLDTMIDEGDDDLLEELLK